MDLRVTISEIINDRGYSKKAIADMMGLAPQKFYDVCYKRRQIKIEEFFAFCRAVRMTPDEVYNYKTAS